MPRAVLVLADLYRGTGDLPDPATVPRLPDFERWLARAACEPLGEAGWREWLRERLEVPPQPPPQSVAGSCRFATPVHRVAGLDTLRLHIDGLLRLPEATQRQLAEGFAREFGNSGWWLEVTAARELLLHGPPLLADMPDPALYRGDSLRAALPTGPGCDTLRGLQSEIEMWLHVANFHADVNHARLKVNGLWLWGSSVAGPLPPRYGNGAEHSDASQGHLYAEDLGARVAAAAAGLGQSPLPQRWPARESARADCYVVLNVAGVDVTGQLLQLLQDWIEPALAARAAGHYDTLELVCGARRWLLDDAARWRLWRRRRHWLPELLAC